VVGICALPFLTCMFPWVLILCFGISLVGSGSTRSLSFSSLARPLGVLILCFGISLVGSGCAPPFFPHLHVPLGFDLVFGISLVWGRDLRSTFPSLTFVFPWGFLILFWNQFSVGSALPFLFLLHVPGVLICFGIRLV
jgi:hypothetical protein